MSIYEYDEELHLKTLFEEGVEQGVEQGIEQGKGCVNKLNALLIDMGRIDDLKRATQDKTYQEQLMIELLSKKI